MYLSNRQLKLLKLLEREDNYQSMSFYSKKLNVSSRTISSDIEKITEEVKSTLGTVVRKRGVGVKFIQSKDFNTPAKEINHIFFLNDRKERTIKIIKKLLFEHKIVTYDQLIEKFYISKTSISNDLDYIEKILTNGNNLKLVRDNNGTRFEGTEKNFRKAHIEFNNWARKELIPREKKSQSTIELLKKLYGNAIVDKCYEVLYSMMKSNIESIADYYVFNVLNALIVIVYRISTKRYINEEIDMKKDYHLILADQILEKISQSLDLSFTDSDTANLSEYLISNRFQLVSVDYGSEILPQLLNKLTTKFDLKFNINNVTHQQLSNHMSTMIYRLKNGIKITNPFIKEIRNEYTELLNILWVILIEFEKELDIIFTEDEIGFLVIYLQSTIEYKKDGRSFLVVCPWGMAASNLLIKQIDKICNTEDRILSTSMKAVNPGEIPQDIDLIFSTVDLGIPENEYIKIPSILGPDDIEKLKEVIKRKESTMNKLQSYKNISEYIDNESILTDTNFGNMEEVINYVSDVLISKNLVNENIKRSFLEREKLGGTDLEVGVAIPHANPQFVNQSTIFVVNNEKLIKWINYKVQYIIFVCISEKDLGNMKEVFSDVFRIIETKDSVSEFFRSLSQ